MANKPISTMKQARGPLADGRHKVAGAKGLFLMVQRGGASRSWVFRMMHKGTRHENGLGSLDEVSLDTARKLAAERLADIRSGKVAGRVDPKAVPTFADGARAVAKEKADADILKGEWQAFGQLERHVFPAFGDRRVDQIERGEIRAAVMAVAAKHPATARALRPAIRAVFNWAVYSGHIERSPAGFLSEQGSVVIRKAGKREAINGDAAPGVYRAIRDGNGNTARTTRLLLAFVALTWCRKGEARLATWAEIDEDARVWTVPGERMKTGVPWRVPLSDTAMDVLSEAKALAPGASPYIFPGQKPGQPIGETTLNLLQTTVAPGTTVHGWRATGRTWAGDNTASPWAVMEISLSHTVGGKVEQSYARGELLEKRRDLMNEWAAYLTGATDEAQAA